MTRFEWPTLLWGERTITVLSDGLQRLDGGAMFGVVPRVLWEKKLPPDERNRIRLGMNCLLVDGPDGRTVIEVGSGDKDDAKFQDIYGLERDGGLPRRLADRGAPPETVDRVVLTHLHFDHAGGATKWADDGRTAVPTFPNATYFIHRGEFEDARNPNARNAASYLKRNYAPLEEAGRVRWVADGDRIDGIRIFETPGHTRHHVSVGVDDGEGRLVVFLGDLVPTTHHLPDPWIMSYDLYPVTTLETKQRFLAEIHDAGWLCAFVHDADYPLSWLKRDGRGRHMRDEERDPWGG
ncbi:MAG TPA: MBL fold metallo-hydrolase [Gemmatimonadota bacterium]|nr:MBL fold metallo-hydrolase [Gemmatimonadota bacterium]